MHASIADGCPAGGVRWQDGHCVPAGVADAAATWVLDYGVTAVGVVLLAAMLAQSVRQRTLTWTLMIAVASASTWWLETFGDWGQHLSYSPKFHHYTLTWWHSARHNPDWMPVMYAVYWVAHAWAVLRLASWWAARRPGRGLGRGILLLSVPLTFVWNLVVEGFAAYMGWWTYEPGFGPVLDMGRGNWPLLWPMLVMFGWINLIAWLVGLPEEHDRLNRLERWTGLGRLLDRPGWHRDGGSGEVGTPDPALVTVGAAGPGPLPPSAAPSRVAAGSSAPAAASGLSPATASSTATALSAGTARFQAVRLLVWLAVFNVTFLLTLDVPLVALRVITGHDSPYLP